MALEMGNRLAAEQRSNYIDNIRADGNSRVHVGNNYYQSEDSCLADLRSTDPRLDKARIEETKGGLLRDSYRWVLDNTEFRRWRNDEHSRLLWIKGDPGKGKTMLLCGIIDELDKSVGNTDLLSFFFCQEADSRINHATAVLRGLIYLLAKQQPSLVSHIRAIYKDAGKRLFEGANAWAAVAQIFTSILKDLSLQSVYLIIDALDECTTDVRLLLDFIVRKSSVSSRVKWIVSSRNWPTIEEQLDLAAQKVRLSLELNEDSISAAVGIYIRDKVDQLARLKKYDDKARDTLQRHLSSNANNTFLWVALVCQDLVNVPRWKVLAKLSAFPPGLDSLYQRMMDQIHHLDDADLYRQILAVVSTVYRPIPLTELTCFVETPEGVSDDSESMAEIIRLCGSFLTLREQTVYFVHQSAREFIRQKAADKVFPSGIGKLHHEIFSKSLQMMRHMLRHDMYRLRHPGCHIDEVRRPDPDPLAAARYACVYWVDHLFDTHAGDTLVPADDLRDWGAVDIFLRERYLYWLEALSLLREMPKGVMAVEKLNRLLQSKASKSRLDCLVRDMRRFIQSHRFAIENAPLQAYNSALIFSPARSLTRQLFQSEGPRWFVDKSIIEEDWDACVSTFEGHSGSVTSVAFSPNGQQLASASLDKTIKLWGAISGACITTFEGHDGSVNSVAFSPDGQQLASASSDKTVKLWDATTGACITTFEGHSNAVNSITFSPDRQQLASASRDETIKLWDAISGTCITTFDGHSDPVSSVAFSPNGQQVASASVDKTLKLWDVTTGACVSTFQGHSDIVESVAFSPKSQKVASASVDKTVKLWDATTGACVSTFEGHSELVSSVAFSPDGQQLASASRDRTVRLWDTTTGACLTTFNAHGGSVYSVAFSPDGQQLASASAYSIVRLWDATIGACVSIDGHSKLVTSVAFSPNGQQVASASADKTIKLWDATTGACVSTFEGHSKLVGSVAFSPDGQQVASASVDRTVKLWDAMIGSCIMTFEGHSNIVTSVAFSPDGQQLASTSVDKTVKLWHATTGACLKTININTTPSHISYNNIGTCLNTEIGSIDLGLSFVSLLQRGTRDTSQVTCVYEYGISDDGVWITYQGKNMLWLPSVYRPYRSAVKDSVICMGCSSGWICFLRFHTEITPDMELLRKRKGREEDYEGSPARGGCVSKLRLTGRHQA